LRFAIEELGCPYHSPTLVTVCSYRGSVEAAHISIDLPIYLSTLSGFRELGSPKNFVALVAVAVSQLPEEERADFLHTPFWTYFKTNHLTKIDPSFGHLYSQTFMALVARDGDLSFLKLLSRHYPDEYAFDEALMRTATLHRMMAEDALDEAIAFVKDNFRDIVKGDVKIDPDLLATFVFLTNFFNSGPCFRLPREKFLTFLIQALNSEAYSSPRSDYFHSSIFALKVDDKKLVNVMSSSLLENCEWRSFQRFLQNRVLFGYTDDLLEKLLDSALNISISSPQRFNFPKVMKDFSSDIPVDMVERCMRRFAASFFDSVSTLRTSQSYADCFIETFENFPFTRDIFLPPIAGTDRVDARRIMHLPNVAIVKYLIEDAGIKLASDTLHAYFLKNVTQSIIAFPFRCTPSICLLLKHGYTYNRVAIIEDLADAIDRELVPRPYLMTLFDSPIPKAFLEFIFMLFGDEYFECITVGYPACIESGLVELQNSICRYSLSVSEMLEGLEFFFEKARLEWTSSLTVFCLRSLRDDFFRSELLKLAGKFSQRVA